MCVLGLWLEVASSATLIGLFLPMCACLLFLTCVCFARHVCVIICVLCLPCALVCACVIVCAPSLRCVSAMLANDVLCLQLTYHADKSLSCVCRSVWLGAQARLAGWRMLTQGRLCRHAWYVKCAAQEL